MRSILTAVLLLSATSTIAAADLRVMTVGDSITYGFHYQPRLKALLEAGGHAVTFVGSQDTNGNKHEGLSGKGIYDFVGPPTSTNHYITTALDAAWSTVPTGAVPVVLVHLGVNNMGHGFGRKNLPNAPLDADGDCLASQKYAPTSTGSYIDAMGDLDGMRRSEHQKQRISTMIDLILDHPSQPRLVVAKILPVGKGHPDYQDYNDNCCERIKEWNGFWAAKVASVTGARAARIAIVDCYTDAEAKRAYGTVPGTSFFGDASAQTKDWVHPDRTDAGGAYTLMANKFKQGIDGLLATTPVTSAVWSGTTWSESSANDGTIATALTVTLSNATFTGADGDNFVSAGKVSASNVPAGLTLVATRTSSTVVTITLAGTASAHANADDIGNLAVAFANSAVSTGAASAVTGLSVNDRRIDFNDPTPTVSATWSGNTFHEAAADDGSIANTLTVTLSNGTFTGVNGDDFASAGKVTARNVPPGLTLVATRTSATVVTVALTGAANAHGNANDIANLGVTFADSALSGGTASAATGLTVADRRVDFTDPAPAAGILAWSSSTASVDEGASIALTVTRSGGNAGVVGVGYATMFGSAGASDFTANSGTLAFAAGETSKTVIVDTLQDAAAEGPETFVVVLSSATGGAMIGSTATTTVTIVDDDGASSAPAVVNPGVGGTRGCGLGSGFTLIVAALALGLRARRGLASAMP